MRRTALAKRAALILLAAVLCALLASCINITVNMPGSSNAASSSAASASSTNAYSDTSSSGKSTGSYSGSSNNVSDTKTNDESANDSRGSQSAAQNASNASGSASSFAVDVPANDNSYAEKHKSGGTYIAPDITVEKNGQYTDKDSVALYIHLYGTVPSNYISKTKARKEGWVNTKGNLWDVLPGKSIGGGGFHNDDNTMPDAEGREWFECDIDYEGGFRNAKRLVYSNDGLIYYTDDHYKTFQRLY